MSNSTASGPLPCDGAIELVQQPAVGRGQHLPGDGAEERRRHERGHHQDAHRLPRSGMSVRATIQPIGAATRQQTRLDGAGDDQRGQQRLDEGRIGEQGAEVGEREVAGPVGERERRRARRWAARSARRARPQTAPATAPKRRREANEVAVWRTGSASRSKAIDLHSISGARQPALRCASRPAGVAIRLRGLVFTP